MSKKQKFLITLSSIFLLVLCGFLLYKSTQKIVYIEYINIGNECDAPLSISNNSSKIEQEFTIPYQMFSGVGLTIGTFDRENNSQYEVIVMDKTENKEITSFTFNASEVVNNNVYELLLDSPIKIDNKHTFSIIIQAKSKVNDKNCIGFWVDENIGNLSYEGIECNSTLCMNIYGGNTNTFWFIFTLGCEIYVVSLLAYILYLYINKKSIKQNDLIQAGILGMVIFSILAGFAKKAYFGDEIDNIVGGMLVSKGRVIYRDYYTQHTPVAYWLCGLFSICQAGSVEQFRLIYYILIAFMWMLLYLRHKDNFGKIKMMLLPILQIVLGIVVATETTMVLSDNIQAICIVAFALEFLQYLKDKKLDWKRSIIVSLSIFFSFGSAFVSVYPIFAICLGVFIKEIIYWVNNKKITFKDCVQRYWKLIIACIIPFAIAFIYLMLTNSLVQAYEQAYKFNTEVYPYYMGLGDNIITPFFTGIRNFIQIIPDAVQNIFKGEDVATSIVKMIVGIEILIVIVKMIRKKEYLKPIILVMFMGFDFTRGGFHSIAFWSSVLTIILVEFDYEKMNITERMIQKLALSILAIFSLGIFMNDGIAAWFNEMEPVSEIQQKVIEETSDGEGVFIDIISFQSTYLVYKNRLPINRLCFILPWYMDWYELDTIEDIDEKKPRVILYNENAEIWKEVGFADYLKRYLNENYEKMEDNNSLWILKQ